MFGKWKGDNMLINKISFCAPINCIMIFKTEHFFPMNNQSQYTLPSIIIGISIIFTSIILALAVNFISNQNRYQISGGNDAIYKLDVKTGEVVWIVADNQFLLKDPKLRDN